LFKSGRHLAPTLVGSRLSHGSRLIFPVWSSRFGVIEVDPKISHLLIPGRPWRIRKLMIFRKLSPKNIMSLQVIDFSPVSLISRVFVAFLSCKGVDFSPVTEKAPFFKIRNGFWKTNILPFFDMSAILKTNRESTPINANNLPRRSWAEAGASLFLCSFVVQIRPPLGPDAGGFASFAWFAVNLSGLEFTLWRVPPVCSLCPLRLCASASLR
jgi:hypothetical protein